MVKTVVASIVLFLFCASLGHGQKQWDWSDTSFVPRLVLKDQARIWSAPFRWDKRQWATAGGVVAMTGVAFLMDEPIHQQNGEIGSWAEPVTHLGDPIAQVLYPALAYTAGAAFKSEKWKQTGLVLAHGVFNTAVVTYAGKIVFGRSRPSQTEEANDFRWFELNDQYHSFPSGHSAGMWCIATILSERHSKGGWEPLLYFGTASAVSLSRIELKEHWLSDVIFGAAIGVGVGKLMTHTRSNTKWHFWPYYDGTTSGIYMQRSLR